MDTLDRLLSAQDLADDLHLRSPPSKPGATAATAHPASVPAATYDSAAATSTAGSHNTSTTTTPRSASVTSHPTG